MPNKLSMQKENDKEPLSVSETEPVFVHTYEEMVVFLKKIGNEAANTFFIYAGQLLNALNIKEGDARITYGTRDSKRLAIIIGQRYCLAYVPNEQLPWHFISTLKIPSTKDIETGKFDGSPKAYYNRCKRPEEMEIRINEIVKASNKQLGPNTKVSGFKKFTNKIFEKAIFDEAFRNQLFQSAYSDVTNLTGNVWKLGCNWARNKSSYYDLIKNHSIVIGVNDKLYSPGDLVVITEGFTVYALGKVLEVPKPVTDVPEFQKEFAAYEIPFNPSINFAKTEWYELEEDEIFTYQLQQGICRVNVPAVRNKAITIWNDRFINYWVFQCNPNEFDFETAVNNKLLNSWKVAAHKDKIKKGDKVILWITGKRDGCYALARVTSDPSSSTASTDFHLWKSEPKMSLQAGVELTHNLLYKPLLWQNIKENEVLKALNVGHQGTNFTATRQQYNALIKLIDSSTQTMDTRIDLYMNTILYGPPGTGKTYKLNAYKEQYFVDRGITKSSEEVLKEKVTEYPYWKIFAAVLQAIGKPISVSEIMAHPIVKAKISDSAKTPQNTVWRILQSYADKESSQMNEKYRGPIELFQKNQDSKWSILDNKKAEIANIIDQELLDLAINPELQPVQSSSFKTRYNFITFHQKYSYEDFIEGIKPLLREEDEEGTAGNLQFELKKGIFYTSCLDSLKLVGYESFNECYNDTIENRIAKFGLAKNDSTKQFALFIDEINRANISAVFGELITVLEDDKRMGADNEMWVELPYSNEKFCVPANLYVIGTMNTADRSIALLDIALRRRFEFKALYPLYMESEWWSPLLEAMNKAIYTWKKNPDFFIGHTFFINKPESERANILNTKIIPLLYEYCQNNTDMVNRILTEAGITLKPSGIRENFQIIAE